jgi:dipeptidyl-peptidase-4
MTPARAADGFLELYAKTQRFNTGRPSRVRVTPDGKTVLFLRSQPTDPHQTLFAFDVATGQTRELLTPQSLLAGADQTLSAAEKARLERQRVTARGFTDYALSEDGNRISVSLSGVTYLVDAQGKGARRLATGDGALDAHFSPDGTKLAYVRDNDLWVLDVASNREHRVTHGGTETLTHGLAEFAAQEEMDRFAGYWWSPDSRLLAYEEADASNMEKLSTLDVMHPEHGADSVPYPRAGTPNAVVRLGVVPASGGKTAWVSWDAQRYPYLATVRWSKATPLTVLVQSRDQREELLFTADPATGHTQPLLEEKDDAWVHLDQHFPAWLEDGSGFFWRTERNGGPEIELRAPTGEKKATWVPPSAGWESWVGFDARSRTLYFTGSADPTEALLWRVREGQAPERFPGGEEQAWQEGGLSKDGQLLVVNSTSLTQMPKTRVLKADGSVVGELPSVAVDSPVTPRVEIRKVGEGQGFYAAVLKPAHAKPGVKLPVVVEVYGGPGHAVVRRGMRGFVLLQWLADQGFVVALFDGRGTPRRGRAWERALKGDFSGVTLDDQVAALHALAAQVPEMDLSRVGIEGWSFGGYMSALAVLKRPDVYKAAVAGAPVVDWHDYDTHYTERYLDTPQAAPGAYDKSSLLSYVKGPARPLLVVHGTADDNVYFVHSLKLADALFKEGKPFELLPLADLTHMVPTPLVTQRLWERIVRHFQQNL